MIAGDEYLPVPTMSREAKVRPAMTNGSLVMSRGAYPPPTKFTISISSPSATTVES